MSSLHIAIDCRVVDPHFPGIGRATLETVRALAHAGYARRLSLLVGPGVPPAALADLAACPGTELTPIATPLRAPGDQWTLPRLLRRLRPDVYHATYYAIPALVPGRVVVTIYDLIPRLFPHYWPNPASRYAINGWTAYAARRGNRVIACSYATAADITRLLPRAADKVRVIPLGVTPRHLPSPREGEGPGVRGSVPYLLYVGSNKPHKNLPRLVAAFARIAPRAAGRLVIAGAWDERYPEAADEARRHGLEDRVIFEHRPSDARLDELFGAASGFVFPSLYEGFGLPVLEAMAAGLPVATTDRGALAEVAGAAALRVNPDDDASIAAVMACLLDNAPLRMRLSAQGRDRAALFPWSRTAREIWTVYEELAAQA